MSVLLLVSFSFKSLLGLKVTFRVAAMLRASPVAGFRPIRAFMSFASKLPNPRKSTLSPDAKLSAIVFRIASAIASTSLFFASVRPATASIGCCFVILPSLNFPRFKPEQWPPRDLGQTSVNSIRGSADPSRLPGSNLMEVPSLPKQAQTDCRKHVHEQSCQECTSMIGVANLPVAG